MLKLLYAAVLVLSTQFALAQCKSGDCNNGKGEFDFGWCTYKGEFKDGKPSGQGTMKYDDYSYAGSFSNGVEDGQGVVTYKNGKTEDVVFSRGVKINAAPAKVAAADWKELKGTDPGCVNGNCETGFGTYKFPSGNAYTGNFAATKRQGKGKMEFANGDVLDGNFSNNDILSGTYKFNNGCSFTGTWDSKGEMYNGTYYSPTGRAVRLDNGKVIPPEPTMVLPANLPKGTIIVNGAYTQEPACENWEVCPRCYGHKVISKPIVTKYSWSTPGTYSIDRYGNRHTEYAAQSGERTSSIPNYEVCDKCGGKGKVCGKGK